MSAIGDLAGLGIRAQELLNVKVKRPTDSNGYLYLQLKIAVWVFPLMKTERFLSFDYHRTVTHREHKAARI